MEGINLRKESTPKYFTSLTVIVPVKEMEGRLQRMSSWLKLSAKYPIQVIVVHDISQDGTGLALKNLISEIKSPKICLLEDEYGSPGAARNAGLNLASSEWVAFWDSDDLPDVSKYLELIDSAEDKGCAIASAGFRVIDEKTNSQIRSFTYSPIFEDNMRSTAMNPGIWRMIFRIDLVKDIRFLKIKVAEDQIFIAQCLKKNSKIFFQEVPIYSYYINPDFQNSRKLSNLSDLAISLGLLASLKEKDNTTLNDFLDILFIRQSLTYLKYFHNTSSIPITITLLKKLISLPMKSMIQIFRAVKKEKMLRN